MTTVIRMPVVLVTLIVRMQVQVQPVVIQQFVLNWKLVMMATQMPAAVVMRIVPVKERRPRAVMVTTVRKLNFATMDLEMLVVAVMLRVLRQVRVLPAAMELPVRSLKPVMTDS